VILASRDVDVVVLVSLSSGAGLALLPGDVDVEFVTDDGAVVDEDEVDEDRPMALRKRSLRGIALSWYGRKRRDSRYDVAKVDYKINLYVLDLNSRF